MGRLKCSRLVTFGTVLSVAVPVGLIFYGIEYSISIRRGLGDHPHFAEEDFEVSRGGVVCPRSLLARSRTGTRISSCFTRSIKVQDSFFPISLTV